MHARSWLFLTVRADSDLCLKRAREKRLLLRQAEPKAQKPMGLSRIYMTRRLMKDVQVAGWYNSSSSHVFQYAICLHTGIKSSY